MRDFFQDWRRWIRAERATVVLIVTTLFVDVPMALAINVHLTTPGQNGRTEGVF